MTSRQSYGLINPNRSAYVDVVEMHSKCKYYSIFPAIEAISPRTGDRCFHTQLNQ